MEKLDEELWVVRSKERRILKQKKFHLQKLKALGDREVRNILELEEDERQEAAEQAPTASPSFQELGFRSQSEMDCFLRASFSDGNLGSAVESASSSS